MKKLLCIALGICLAACAFVGCEDKSLRFSSENSVFDIDELKEVSFIEKNDKAVDYIYGNNVTTADYAIAGSAVVFKVQYLVTFPMREKVNSSLRWRKAARIKLQTAVLKRAILRAGKP